MTNRRNLRARHKRHKARTAQRKRRLRDLARDLAWYKVHRNRLLKSLAGAPKVYHWPHRNPVKFVGGPLDGQVLHLEHEEPVHQFAVWAICGNFGDPFCVTHVYQRKTHAIAMDLWSFANDVTREAMAEQLIDRMVYVD